MNARFFRSWLCMIGLLVFAPCIGARAQDQLDINILKFMVAAPMEQVLSKLHNYGVLVCFEKRPEDSETEIALNLENVSVREILDAAVRADKRYYWEVYKSHTFPIPTMAVVNVLPVGAKNDMTDVMNTRISSIELDNIDPYFATRDIYKYVPEVEGRYYAVSPRGETGESIGPYPADGNVYKMSLMMRGVTLRDLMNEICVRSGGLCWMYEVRNAVPRYVWRVFY